LRLNVSPFRIPYYFQYHTFPTQDYLLQELNDWGKYGVEGHFLAKNPWLSYHETLTDKMAKIVGALPQETVMMNQLTVNLHLLMVSFCHIYYLPFS
jgi:kynureninase